MDTVDRETRSRIMSRIRSSGTRPERVMAAALRRAGLSGFTRNDRRLPGTPDFAFREARLAVFVDGDFWHWRTGKVPGSNRAFWLAKLSGNRRRDRRADRALSRAGWSRARVWETDLMAAPDRIASRIASRVAGKPFGLGGGRRRGTGERGRKSGRFNRRRLS